MKQNSGFTLVEAMITMVVMGIVLSYTIPTLIINSRDQERKAGYQRAINILNNAYNEYTETNTSQLTSIDEFETKYKDIYKCANGSQPVTLLWWTFCWSGGLQIDPIVTTEAYQDKVGTKQIYSQEIGATGLADNDQLLSNLFKRHLSLLKTETNKENLNTPMAGCADGSYYFYTADGMRYCYKYESLGNSEEYSDKMFGTVWVDINGEKSPNMVPINETGPGDTLPIVILNNRFVPGHPSDTTVSSIVQKIYFGEK